MTQLAIPWKPVPDIDGLFGRIAFFNEGNEARDMHVVMFTEGRKLSLKFTRVIAFQFEDDCPGNFNLPELPMLRANVTFPLLRIENSQWLSRWPMWPGMAHYVLLSLDDLVQLIALPTAEAHWE